MPTQKELDAYFQAPQNRPDVLDETRKGKWNIKLSAAFPRNRSNSHIISFLLFEAMNRLKEFGKFHAINFERNVVFAKAVLKLVDELLDAGYDKEKLEEKFHHGCRSLKQWVRNIKFQQTST